jgi:hypothetical protein
MLSFDVHESVVADTHQIKRFDSLSQQFVTKLRQNLAIEASGRTDSKERDQTRKMDAQEWSSAGRSNGSRFLAQE